MHVRQDYQGHLEFLYISTSISYLTIWNGAHSNTLQPEGCHDVKFVVTDCAGVRVTHICAGKLPTIGSDNGQSPGRCQAVIWTNAGILLIGPLGTNANGILIDVQTFSLKKIRLKMPSAKCLSVSASMCQYPHWRQCCHFDSPIDSTEILCVIIIINVVDMFREIKMG